MPEIGSSTHKILHGKPQSTNNDVDLRAEGILIKLREAKICED
jgi:hypothetical protein